MWLFLGLLGSISALSASDVFVSSGQDEDTQDDPEQAGDASEQWSELAGYLSSSFPDEDGEPILPDPSVPEGELPDPDLPIDVPAPGMGLHDHLGQRVHSSDEYPEPESPAPETLVGGAAGELLRGSELGDSIVGNGGNDSLTGLGGDDWLDGGAGNDSLIGGEGDDTLVGGTGNDTLIGGAGHDVIHTGSGTSTVMAGDGDDTVIGTAGGSFLNGGAGNDLLQGASGNNLHGGSGDDVFLLSALQEGAIEPLHILDYTAGEDVIQLSYDPALGVPELSITHHPDQPNQALIWLDDQILATVANAGGLTTADISLVAQAAPAA